MSISDDQMVQTLSKIEGSVGRIEGKLDATITAHNTRFEAIEEQIKINDKRQWIASFCVIPVVSALHYLANKIGIKV